MVDRKALLMGLSLGASMLLFGPLAGAGVVLYVAVAVVVLGVLLAFAVWTGGDPELFEIPFGTVAAMAVVLRMEAWLGADEWRWYAAVPMYGVTGGAVAYLAFRVLRFARGRRAR